MSISQLLKTLPTDILDVGIRKRYAGWHPWTDCMGGGEMWTKALTYETWAFFAEEWDDPKTREEDVDLNHVVDYYFTCEEEIDEATCLILCLWMLHPRKGASRGIEIRNIQEDDLPVIRNWLEAHFRRTSECFAWVTKEAGDFDAYMSESAELYRRATWTAFQEFVFRLESGRPISERAYYYYRSCKEIPLLMALIEGMPAREVWHLQDDLDEIRALDKSQGDVEDDWQDIFDREDEKGSMEPYRSRDVRWRAAVGKLAGILCDIQAETDADWWEDVEQAMRDGSLDALEKALGIEVK